MVRTRFVPVPESDTEIIEEEITQRQTKTGIRIQKKRTPMTRSLPENAEKPSGSRSKAKKKAQVPQAKTTTERAEEDAITRTYEPGDYSEYQGDDIPEEPQHEINVNQLCLHIIVFNMCHRLLWINGLNIGVDILMCSSKWRVEAHSQCARSVRRALHTSSAPIVSEGIHFASLVASNTIGGHHFTI